MSVDLLYEPVEQLEGLLSSSLDGAPLPAVLAVAALLGLRHALDPDHLVAVTSLVATRGRDVRVGMRLGAWWGVGHALTLVLLGIPMIFLQRVLPVWLEIAAEKAIGVVIVLLGVRLIWSWRRGRTRVTQHAHPPAPPHRHAHHLDDGRHHPHDGRAARQALGIGALHGVAGTGAVVLLLLAALPDRSVTVLALALFAVTSVLSMVLCTGCFAWLLTRPRLERTANRVLVPTLGVVAILFGVMYAAS